MHPSQAQVTETSIQLHACWRRFVSCTQRPTNAPDTHLACPWRSPPALRWPPPGSGRGAPRSARRRARAPRRPASRRAVCQSIWLTFMKSKSRVAGNSLRSHSCYLAFVSCLHVIEGRARDCQLEARARQRPTWPKPVSALRRRSASSPPPISSACCSSGAEARTSTWAQWVNINETTIAAVWESPTPPLVLDSDRLGWGI
jgi:hypothetical protein